MLYWVLTLEADEVLNAFQMTFTDPYRLQQSLETTFSGDLRYRRGYRITVHPTQLGSDAATLWTLHPYNTNHIDEIIETIQGSEYTTHSIKMKNLDSIPEWIYKQIDARSNCYNRTYEDILVHRRGEGIIEVEEESIKTSWCCYKY